MAFEEEQKKQDEGKGFAGLSSMVSDIEATLESTSKQTQNNSIAASSRESLLSSPSTHAEQWRPEAQTYQPPVQSSGASSTGKRLLGIAAVIGIIWIISESDNDGSSSGPAYSSGSHSSASVAPAPAWVPPIVQPQPPTLPTEDKPPVGSGNVLTTAQIRYCLAEDIRLDAAKLVINNYIGTDVNLFNGLVADYNNRCSDFRYRQGTLESARAEIERYRGQLRTEGRSRFVRSSAAGAKTTTPDSPRPTADATVQGIQRRLNELGYDPGSADGLFGERTRSAILAFQRDYGLIADGIVSQSLLEKTVAADRRADKNTPTQLSGSEWEVRRLDLSTLTRAEKESIESACSTDKHVNGPAAYNKCLTGHLASLSRQDTRPDLSRLSNSERQSIESACSTDKYVNGPAIYNNCLNSKLLALAGQATRPDLSRLTSPDRQSIEAACSTDKYVNGPAAYNACLSRQLTKLRS